MMNLSSTTPPSNTNRIQSRPSYLVSQRTSNLETEAERLAKQGLGFVLRELKNFKLDSLTDGTRDSFGRPERIKTQTGTYVNPQGQKNKVRIEYNNIGDVSITLDNYRLSMPLKMYHQISGRSGNFTELKIPYSEGENVKYTLEPQDKDTKEEYNNLSKLIEELKEAAGYKTLYEGGFD